MAEFERTDRQSGFGLGGAFAAAMVRDARAWTGLQCEVLGGVERLCTEWLRRQNEAMIVGTRSLQSLCDGRPLAEIARLQGDWMAEASRHAAEAFKRWAGDGVVMTREAARAAEQAVSAANESAPQPMSQQAAE